MDEQASDSGRDRIRRMLDRLDEAGLKRPRGMTLEAHRRLRQRLTDQLAYLSGENLDTLAELILDHAGGKQRDTWPSEVVIRQLARGLERPPVDEHRIVTSWLASVEGPVAEAGGWLVELYRWLRQHRRPPMAYDVARLQEEARANRRAAQLIAERIGRGSASEADRQWLEAYRRDARDAGAIVARGAQGRQQKEAAA